MARTLHPGDAVYFVCAGEFSNVSGSSVALKVGGIVSFASRAACPACVQPNFLRAAKPKAKTALKTAGLKTRDAPIEADMRDKSAKRARAPIARSLIISGEWRYSVGVTIVLLTPPSIEYRVFKITRLILVAHEHHATPHSVDG